MSDVSNFTPLLDNVSPDPYYELVTKAHDLIIRKYGLKIRTDGAKIESVIETDDDLKKLYRTVSEQYGYKQAASYRNTVKRRIKCFIAVDKNKNIIGWEKDHWACKIKGCQRCGPYRAYHYLRYPNEIVMIGECDDMELSHKTVHEMNEIFVALDYDYIVATTIPTYDGRNIISIACLRYPEIDTLADNNEVKDALNFVEHEYKFLERVDSIDNGHQYEKTYITRKSNILFTTTNLYETMPAGQGTPREKGKISGYYFDYDKMEVVYMTKKDVQKKTDKDNGVVMKFDSPVASSDVPDDVKKTAIKRTIKRTSMHPERAAYFADSNEDVAYEVKRFNSVYIDELEDLGFPQPDVQVGIKLTQNNIDQYKSLIGIPKNGGFPDNILNIEFDDLDREVYGIRDRVSLIRQRLMYQTQQKLKDNITNDDLVDRIINQIKSKPPG